MVYIWGSGSTSAIVGLKFWFRVHNHSSWLCRRFESKMFATGFS